MKAMRLATCVLVVLVACASVFAQVDFNKPLVADKDTVLLLHFDEGKGEPQDASAAKHAVRNRDAAWTTEGKFGGAMDLADGICLVEHADTLACPEAMTVEAWIKPTAEDVSGGFHILVHKADSPPEGNARLYFLLAKGGVQNYPDFKVAVALEPGKWHHIAYVVTGTQEAGGKEYLFLDGVLLAAKPSVWLGLTQKGVMRIGGLSDKAEAFRGVMDELRISRVARPYPGVEVKK